ncbi:MAG: hypothetical protein MPW16_08630 [Candidatus Manganitrophus sp.]|nr:MAG: hypothetical protein MPW16_08630 [Candidatus Manganitrophus sp.]
MIGGVDQIEPALEGTEFDQKLPRFSLRRVRRVLKELLGGVPEPGFQIKTDPLLKGGGRGEAAFRGKAL